MSAPSDRPLPRQSASAFSRQVKVDDLPDDGLVMTIEANTAECTAVAEEIGLPAIGAIKADFRITEQPGGRVQVDGEVQGRITQVCVVTLEPFESDVTHKIEMTFAHVKPALPERHARQRNTRDAVRRAVEMRAPPPVQVGEGEDDPPDPIVDGRIDLGNVAVEFLTLALDFYPKKPGVHFSDVVIGETDEPKPSAFAALGRFKDRS